jgi:hypothetical protein
VFRLVISLLLTAVPIGAQSARPASTPPTGTASFTVYQRGTAIGTVDTWVSRADDNWHVQSSSRVAGTLNVTYKQLDLRYDSRWRGRFLTMEVERAGPRGAKGPPDRMIVHVAVATNTARTDIVREKEARFQSHSVSPDTIFLPDGAFGAYEAVAARLMNARPGMDLPLFTVPVSETRGAIDALSEEMVRTTSGTIRASRFTVIEIRPQPTPVEIWVDRGRLLRLDVPRDGVSVVRADVRDRPIRSEAR